MRVANDEIMTSIFSKNDYLLHNIQAHGKNDLWDISLSIILILGFEVSSFEFDIWHISSWINAMCLLCGCGP